jgi:hypothetical protein
MANRKKVYHEDGTYEWVASSDCNPPPDKLCSEIFEFVSHHKMSWSELNEYVSSSLYASGGYIRPGGMEETVFQLSNCGIISGDPYVPLDVPDYSSLDTDTLVSVILNQLPEHSEIEDYLYNTSLDLISELRFDSNNIANIIEIIELVKGLRQPLSLLESAGNFAKSLKGLDGWKDAWLKYRYVYNTTKSDLNMLGERWDEITSTREDYVKRASNPELVNTHITLYAHEDFSGAETVLDGVLTSLKRLGLQPDLYNAWDMIPFSFVADWFLPIGDYLEHMQKVDWMNSMPYKFKLLVSHKGTITYDSGVALTYYVRYAYDIPDGSYSYEPPSSNPKTWVKRGLDIISLS